MRSRRPPQSFPSGTGLVGNFNYVRNSVKVIVNAYTGDLTFYAVTDTDPILNTWESIFPRMFKPLSDMDAVLQAHLRYPAALLMVQATMYGRYHLTNPAAFYIANNAWELAPTSGTGSPEQSLPVDALGKHGAFRARVRAPAAPRRARLRGSPSSSRSIHCRRATGSRRWRRS